MIDEDDCGAIGGMKIGRGDRSTWREPAPATLCPPQIPHDQVRAQTPGRHGGKPATNRLSLMKNVKIGSKKNVNTKIFSTQKHEHVSAKVSLLYHKTNWK
jgi:hypothetical protein